MNTMTTGTCSASLQAHPFLKDQKKYRQLVDPLLRGRFPRRCLNYAIAITAMCLNEEANFRPLITDIVVALEYLISQSRGPDSENLGIQRSPQSRGEVLGTLHMKSDSKMSLASV